MFKLTYESTLTSLSVVKAVPYPSVTSIKKPQKTFHLGSKTHLPHQDKLIMNKLHFQNAFNFYQLLKSIPNLPSFAKKKIILCRILL